MLRVQKKQGLENELFQIKYRCERTSFILLRFKNPNLLSSPLNILNYFACAPFSLPVESALIAQTSICSRFH